MFNTLNRTWNAYVEIKTVLSIGLRFFNRFLRQRQGFKINGSISFNYYLLGKLLCN